MKIQIILFDGFDELDAIAPFEVLTAAQDVGADLTVEMVTLNGQGTVVAQHGLPVGITGTFDESADILLVPGGGWNARKPQSAWTEAQKGDIPRALALHHQRGGRLASVCTGAMLLATGGLLNGRPATTHHGAIGDLRAAGAQIIEARVVDDDDIITAGGVTSGLDLALWLVERYYGKALATRVEERLEYQRRGEVWLRTTD